MRGLDKFEQLAKGADLLCIILGSAESSDVELLDPQVSTALRFGAKFLGVIAWKNQTVQCVLDFEPDHETRVGIAHAFAQYVTRFLVHGELN
jgi:hypothetical protein